MNKKTLSPRPVRGINSVVMSFGNNFFKKNWQYVLLSLFILVGAYLRSSGVFTNSFAFTYDVGRDLLEVQKIVKEFDVPLIGQTTGLGGLYYGPWWYYILTPPFIVSSGNPQGIAFFMVILGIAAVIAGYILGLRTGGKALGIITAGFLSFSSVMVGFSNQIWNPNIAPLLLILLFICMLTNFKKKNKEIIRNFLIGFLMGIILDAEIVFGVLLMGAVVLTYIISEKREFFSKNKIIIFLGLLFTLLPRIFFEIRHNFVMTKSLFLPKEEDQQVFDIFNFFNVFPERLTVFVGQIGETFGVGFYPSILLCILAICTLLVFRNKLSKLEKKTIETMFIILGVFLVGSSFFARAIWGHYIVGLPVIYILILSLVLLLIVKKNKTIGILLSIIFIFLSSRPDVIISNVQNPNWEGNAAVYRNQVAVIDYIYKDANGKQFNYIAYTPVVHDYTYQYLFDWYGKKAYGYSPSIETQDSLYVVIEQDPGYEGRIKDWLKIREGDGEVIAENVVKGGISVQKRRR